jgi:RNA polymerase sigma factor (TIGR02999 family)
MTGQSDELTQLLNSWSNGDDQALDKLIPLVYAELRKLARRHMGRENPDHTLQTSALINEAYLKLIDQQSVQWQNRAHFFAVAAQVMRHILIDHARAQRFAKRGAGAAKVSLDETAVLTDERASELVALDDALTTLASLDSRKSRIVELRFFGGLSIEETAEIMKISPVTVTREWRAARAWLRQEMSKK